MVKGDNQPIGSAGVANVASFSGRQMACRFTDGYYIIMAVLAGVAGLVMRKGHDQGQPGQLGVARLARIGRLRVSGSFICGVTARVARLTNIAGLIMSEWDNQRHPNRR
jgi:hypothetical protein